MKSRVKKCKHRMKGWECKHRIFDKYFWGQIRHSTDSFIRRGVSPESLSISFPTSIAPFSRSFSFLLSLLHLEEKEKWQALWPFGSLWCFRSLFCYLGPTQEAKPSNPSLSLLSILLHSRLLLPMRIYPAWGTISTIKLVHRQSPL